MNPHGFQHDAADEDPSIISQPSDDGYEDGDAEERSITMSSVFGSVAQSSALTESTGVDEQQSVGLTPGELARLGNVFGQSFGSGSVSEKQPASQQGGERGGAAQGQEQQQPAEVPKLFDSPSSSSQNVPSITFTQYSISGEEEEGGIKQDDTGAVSPSVSGSESQQRRISFAPSTKPGVVLPAETNVAPVTDMGGLFSLIANPMEYIFGGADDDDINDEVSEMGGTFFNDASSLWGGESMQSKALALAARRASLTSMNNSGRELPPFAATPTTNTTTASDKVGKVPFTPSRETLVTSISEPIFEVDDESTSRASASSQTSSGAPSKSRASASSRASSRAPSKSLNSYQEQSQGGGMFRGVAEEKSVASQSYAVMSRTADDKSMASRSFAAESRAAVEDRSIASRSFAPSAFRGNQPRGDQSIASRSLARSVREEQSVVSRTSARSFKANDSVARSQVSSGYVPSSLFQPPDTNSRVGSDNGSLYSMGSFAKLSQASSTSKARSSETEMLSDYVGNSSGSSEGFDSNSAFQLPEMERHDDQTGHDAATRRQGSQFRATEEGNNNNNNNFNESTTSDFGRFNASQSLFGDTSHGSDAFTYDQRREYQLANDAATRARSTRSMASTGSELFRLHPEGPVMSRSPSGRAVVHVALRSDQQGGINKLEYTTPIMAEPDFQDESDHYTTARERSVRSNYRSVMDGDSYSYFPRQNAVPPVAHRKWARIQAMLFLLALAATAVTIAATAVTIATFSNMGNGAISRNTSAAQASPTSPGITLTAPSASTSPAAAPTSSGQQQGPTAPVPAFAPTPKTYVKTRVPEPLATNVMDWVTSSATIPDVSLGVPFYWSVPFSGSAVLQDVFGACFGFAQASEVGASWATNKTLAIFQVSGEHYVNVDTTTIPGLEHAASLHLVPSKMANIIYSPLLNDAIEKLYDKDNQARLIITLRHPVHATVAMYHYLQNTPSDPRYTAALATMTLEDFAVSSYVSNNLLTRVLVNKLGGGLSSKDVEQAKLILRQKAVVGTYDDVEGALHRIAIYFGFSMAGDIGTCSSERLKNILANQYVVTLDSGSTAYALIEQRCQYDIQLYNYLVNVLVPHQDQLLASRTSSSN